MISNIRRSLLASQKGSGYPITITGSHFTYDGPSTIGEGNIAEITFTPNGGYELTTFAVTGATLRNVDYTTYKILIENPTGNVTIAVTSIQPDYFWIENIGQSNISVASKDGWQYSKDKLTWTTSTQTVAPNEKLYYKGFVGKTSSTNKPNIPTNSGYMYNVGGNAYTLINPRGIVTGTDWSLNNCFSLTKIVDAFELTLNEDVLTPSCYYNMFGSCKLLTRVPNLPATTLADYCYGNMFYGCTSLTNAPKLPATTLAEGCYQYMFSDCTSLTRVPNLPATTLAENCYYFMFGNCTSLKVYSKSSSGHNKLWKIPNFGTFTNTSTQPFMFKSVQTDSIPAAPTFTAGTSNTYYTQNIPA